MLSLNKHAINASIAERYASICYEFEFENKSDVNGSNELKFALTIDAQAFICGFSADIDGELFIGETKEKKKAKQEYVAAKEKNENAILISQPYPDIANVFEIKTNIDSKSKILLKIQIEQYLQKKFNFNELSIEILKEFHKYNIKKNYDAISFNLEIADKSGIYDIQLPANNEIVIEKNVMDKNDTLCTMNGKMAKNCKLNEFRLKYKIKGEQNESNILYDAKSKTFVHVISDIISDSTIKEMTAQNIAAAEGDHGGKEMAMIPRRVIFVVDKSGSMSGTKWDKTISATVTALKQLRTGYDRYGIIFFDDELEFGPNIFDKSNIAESISYVQKQGTGGATDVNLALLKGIDLIESDMKLMSETQESNFFVNQLVLITDGEPNSGVTDTNTIISNVMQENKVNKISIFCFGVGSDKNDSSWTQDLNHSFLKLLALNNDGIYKRIKESNCETQLNEYFDVLSKPVLSNINVQYEGIDDVDLTKTCFNTLYAGNDIIICGQLKNDKILTMTANITAITGKQSNVQMMVKPIEINKKIKVSLNEMDDEKDNDNDKDTDNIERIWAYLKLQQFAENKLISNDMIEYDEDEHCEQIALALALKYKFVTPWTSMIVVKHKLQQNEEKAEEKDEQNEAVFEEKKKFDIDALILQTFDIDALQSDMTATMEETDEALKIAMEQYAKLTVPWKKESFLPKKRRRREESEDDKNAEDVEFEELDFEECLLLDDFEETVTLRSGGANPVSFEVDKRCVESSKFCTTIFEGDADATSIQIRCVDAETLKLVIHYLRNEHDTDVSVWDVKIWIDSFDLMTLSQIEGAANYMDIESLCDLAKEAVDRKEKQMNVLIDTKMANMDKMANINLESCCVANMVYLIQTILLNKEFDLNQQQKEMICTYFVENKIDGKLFKLQTEKNEFLQNITDFIQENLNDEKNRVSNVLLKLLQTKILQVTC